MALNVDAVGTTTSAHVHHYTWKDVVLYALSVGATTRELDFLYEKHGPKVLPTYAVIPTFAVVSELFEIVGGDLLGVVHNAQRIRLHRTFSPEATLHTTGTVKGVYDLKRLAEAVFTTETREGDELVCETEWQILFRLDGGFGGPRPPASLKVRAPDREPDFEVSESTTPEQAALYRLNGDLNPLHIDPEIGEKVGFGSPILHGLCTFGYVGRAVLHSRCGGDPSRLKELRCQFRKPVWPGDTLITRGWDEGDQTVLRLTTRERPQEMAVTNAYAVVTNGS